MMNHGLVRACERPEAVVVDEHSVWVASEVQSVTVRDESGEHTEYEFNLVQYEKDEFIHGMIEQNRTLEQQLTDTQIALCDVYELIAT